MGATSPPAHEGASSGKLEFILELFSIASHFTASAKVLYAIEVVTPEGSRVATYPRAPAVTLRRGQSIFQRLVTPAKLPAGIYALRVTAGARGDDGESVVSSEQYFEVSGSSVFPADEESWNDAQVAYASATGDITPDAICLTCDDDPPPPGGGTSTGSGVVSGHFTFFQHQGAFCPAAEDCYGARYLESEWHHFAPVREARIDIYDRGPDGTGTARIGFGSTDANGYYSVSWSKTGASSVLAEVVLTSQHKDGRFKVLTIDGDRFGLTIGTGARTALASQTTSFGEVSIGVPSAPNARINVYDGAYKTWSAFQRSNRMLTYFTGVEVRTFTDGVECPTSCADGKIVKLNPAAAYTPAARVMHELGHVGSNLANRDQTRTGLDGNYCWPEDNGDCDWTMTEPEWSSASFEEALATFFGDVGRYDPWARRPFHCFSELGCGSDGTLIRGSNLELRTDPTCSTSATNPENRWPLSVERYLWDAYDQADDGEALQREFYEFFDTIHAFDNGMDNRQKDEPYTWAYWIDDRDGRSAVDFRENWKIWGTDSTVAYDKNCQPVGD